jgi:hypothetical protein
LQPKSNILTRSENENRENNCNDFESNSAPGEKIRQAIDWILTRENEKMTAGKIAITFLSSPDQSIIIEKWMKLTSF